jgi:molybdopterin-binding protein
LIANRATIKARRARNRAAGFPFPFSQQVSNAEPHSPSPGESPSFMSDAANSSKSLARGLGIASRLPPPRPVSFLPMRLSARNRIIGKIEELHVGDIMAHVVVRSGEIIIESVITRRSAEEMKLKVGDTVGAIIKSTEVILEKA